MTESADFYVAILAAVDDDELSADIVYLGRQVADIRRIDGVWTVTNYGPRGAEQHKLPLSGFLAALNEAFERLQEVYEGR